MLVDSKKTQLEVEPIIILGADEDGEDLPPATIYAATIAEMNMPNVTLFQEGNTLFLVHHIGPREGLFKIINADIAENYLENFYIFIQVAHKFGYDILYSEISVQEELNLYKALLKNPPLPDMNCSVEKTEDGVAVVLKLGKPREK